MDMTRERMRDKGNTTKSKNRNEGNEKEDGVEGWKRNTIGHTESKAKDK